MLCPLLLPALPFLPSIPTGAVMRAAAGEAVELHVQLPEGTSSVWVIFVAA